MKSIVKLLACSTVLAATVAVAGAQQITNSNVRERYERHTKGTNLDDFARRLGSDDADERLDAVKSLENSKDTKAVDYLLQALGDPDMRVKARAIDGLGNLRAPEATPVLIQQLFLKSTDVSVKRRILASLGKIGDASAAPAIQEFLQLDLDTATRGTAVFALGEIGAPESLPALESIEKGSQDPALVRVANEAAAKVRYHQSMKKVEAKEPQNTFLKDDGLRPPREAR